MKEFDISFELHLGPAGFDENSDVLYDLITQMAETSKTFSDVHGGGEMATGLLNIRVQVASSDLYSATASAYQLVRDAIAKSQIEVEIRNQSAFAV
jgi:tripartite-type tricarboxylate transporter receptor subunit TctC